VGCPHYHNGLCTSSQAEPGLQASEMAESAGLCISRQAWLISDNLHTDSLQPCSLFWPGLGDDWPHSASWRPALALRRNAISQRPLSAMAWRPWRRGQPAGIMLMAAASISRKSALSVASCTSMVSSRVCDASAYSACSLLYLPKLSLISVIGVRNTPLATPCG